MKMYKAITFFACVIFLLSSCDKEERVIGIKPDNAEGIRFEIGFAGQGTGGMKTRAATDKDFRTTWEDGDAIGIFAVEHATGQTATLVASGNYIHNVKLTYNKAANTWTPVKPLYFPAGENRQLDFYAYYPYIDLTEITPPTQMAFGVQTDQSGNGFNVSDLMFAKVLNVSKGGTASLYFNHLFTLVEVDISESSDNTPLYVPDKLKVSLCGVQNYATVDLSHNPVYPIVITSTLPSDILMHRVDMGDATKYVYRAVVPAQDFAAGHKLFTFKQDLNGNGSYTDGNEFSLSYTLAAQTNLAPGNALLYNIRTVEQTPDLNHVYAVGDYYPHIGRVVGVVFRQKTTTQNGLMVNLNEASLKEWTEAKNWANAQTAGRRTWYCPDKDELLALFNTKIEVNTALAGISGAIKLVTYGNYWSSSEYNSSNAWFVSFSGGSFSFTDKTLRYRVRAVSAF